MTTSQTGSLSDYLRQVLRAWQQDSRSDGDLLTAFAQSRENSAFATLVSRHGPLVWGVCQRILRNRQDAEDAFQATFLVLAQHAGQVRLKELIGHYLYGVAQRTAWKLRSSIASRQRHEKLRSTMMPITPSESEEIDADLLSVLEEEVRQLPEYYRDPLSLCRLEGRTYGEAARLLNCHLSTVSYRVARAEELLRERLTRRGVSLAGASTAVLLSQATAVPALPARLLGETVRAALAFVNHTLGPTRAVWIAQGVLQTMASNKVLLWWGVTVAALLCLGSAGLGLVAQPVPPAMAQGTVTAPAELQAPAVPGGQRLDYYGDPLPEGALARLGTLRFQPDKRGNGWNYDGAFLPDGKTLVSIHETNTVHFWDVATGKERRRLQIQEIKDCARVSVSPDGRLLAVSGQSEVQVWDLTVDPPRPRWTHQAQGGRIVALALSPDGKTLAYSTGVSNTHLLDAKTGKQRQTLNSAGGEGMVLAFSPDGKYLAEGGAFLREGTVCLWEVAQGKVQHTFTSPRWFVGFAPDSRTLATWDDMGGITLWDVTTGKEKRQIARAGALVASGGRAFVSAFFLPDGTLLESDGARLRFWDPDTGKQRRPEIETPYLCGRPLLSPDGKLLAVASHEVVRVWQVETGKPLGPYGMPRAVQEIAFSPSGDTLATRDGGFGHGTVELWQAHTGAPGPRLKFPPPQQQPFLFGGRVTGLNYDCDHRLYTLRGIHDVGVQIISGYELVGWDMRTGKAVELPQGIRQAAGKLVSNAPIMSPLAMSPDGRLLALRQGDAVVLYELATGKEVHSLQGLPRIESLRRLVFSVDGQSLVASSSDLNGEEFNLAVWDVVTGRQKLRQAAAVWLGGVLPFSLSPDGRWLAVRELSSDEPDDEPDRGVRLWEIASGQAGPRFQAQKKIPTDVAFAPDGRTLAAGYEDGTVQLWEMSSGQTRRTLTGHRGKVEALAFSADGLRLASGGQDRTALVWDLRRPQPPAAVAAADRPKTEQLLAALAKADAAVAHRAIYQLVEAPETSIAELRKRLQPIPPADAKQVQRWLDDLDGKDFKARERAFAELTKNIDSVEAALRKALDGSPALEKRQRLEKLLALLDPSRNPARLIVLRGVEVLERIGTPEAQKVLQELAQLQGYLVGSEAQAALRRLARSRPDAGMP